MLHGPSFDPAPAAHPAATGTTDRAALSQIDPQSAAVGSMVFPGLGHWKLGRRADVIARFAMFGWRSGP
jgi:hypothetical protein